MLLLHLLPLTGFLFLSASRLASSSSSDEDQFICSNGVEHEVRVDGLFVDRGVLLGHDQPFSDQGFLYSENLPANCSLSLFADGPGIEVVLKFDEFYLPSDNECSRNYVAVFAVNTDDETTEELGVFCGSDELLPTFVATVNNSLLIEVSISEPFRGFRLSFSKKDDERAAISCNERSHFRCPEDKDQCLPKSYKCDDMADCPNGGDESECDETVKAERKKTSGCGSPRNQSGGEYGNNFSSLNYPLNYTNFLKCIWEITAIGFSGVRLTFDKLFDVDSNSANCEYDSVTIYSRDDSATASSSLSLVARLCGEKAPEPIVVASQRVLVVFETDSQRVSSGFRLSWSAVNVESDDLQLEDRLMVSPSVMKFFGTSEYCKIGNDEISADDEFEAITDLEGEVFSPDYGSTYPSKMICIWRFRPKIPAQKKFKLLEFRFKDFDVKSLGNCTPAAVQFKFTDHGGKIKTRHSYCNSKMAPLDKPITMTNSRPEFEVKFYVRVKNPQNVGRGIKFTFRVILSDVGLQPGNRNEQNPSPILATMISPSWLKSCRNCGKTPIISSATSNNRQFVSAGNGEDRVVGGKAAKPGMWRWAAHLIFEKGQFCGGSVIYPRWILTAAHCFGLPGTELHQVKGWNVYLARHNVYVNKAWDMNSAIVKPEIEAIFVHANYSKTLKKFDIALIKLKKKVPLDGLVAPICLPSRPPEMISRQQKCVVVGWGDTHGTANIEGILQEAYMPIIDTDYCKTLNTLYGTLLDNEHMICAGYEKGLIDSCKGDSGGALACQNLHDNSWEVQGIVSFGKGCAGAKAPGVYTRVWHFRDWITTVISENLH